MRAAQAIPPAGAVSWMVRVAAITDVVDAEESVAWLQGALGELHATLAARNAPGSGPAGGIADQPKVNT